MATWGIANLMSAALATAQFLRSDLILEVIFGMLLWKIRHFRLLKQWPAWFMLVSIVLRCALMAYFELREFAPNSLTFGLPSFVIVTFALGLEPQVKRLNATLVRWLCHLEGTPAMQPI